MEGGRHRALSMHCRKPCWRCSLRRVWFEISPIRSQARNINMFYFARAVAKQLHLSAPLGFATSFAKPEIHQWRLGAEKPLITKGKIHQCVFRPQTHDETIAQPQACVLKPNPLSY